MAAILGDICDGEAGTLMVSSIAMTITTASVVFRPEDGVVWVATGEAPTSRNAYVPFALGREDAAFEHGELPAAPPSAADTAQAHYRRGYAAYLDDGDSATARREVTRGRASSRRVRPPITSSGVSSPSSSATPPTPRAASRAPSPSATRTPSACRPSISGAARARDALGRRGDALADYRAALGRPSDPPIRAAALAALRRPPKPRRVSIDFVLADVVSP
jgi:hypothetical protein